MSIVNLPDGSGEQTLKLLEVDGKMYPDIDGINLIKQIKTYSMRSDDIMICGFPKCGTHWVWEIVRCILAQTTDLPVQGKGMCMLEIQTNSELEKLPSPRALNCHLPYKQLPDEMVEKKCKIIYVLRNLKDMMVSFYHHNINIPYTGYSGEWKYYFPMVLAGKLDYGCCFEYVREWEEFIVNNKSHPILVLYYEDMKENIQREVSKIAKFLDKDCSDEFIQEVCDKCDFDVMKRTMGHLLTNKQGESSIYRKGQVGDWKNYFTIAQNEMFEKVYAEKMAGSKLTFRYEI